MRQTLSLLLAFVLCLCAVYAYGEENALSFVTAPDALRPGKVYNITIHAPRSGTILLLLLNEAGEVAYDIFSDYPVTAGNNVIHWDGLKADYSVIEQGQYTLQLRMDEEVTETSLRLGAPYPLITRMQQTDESLDENVVTFTFDASVAGTVSIALYSQASKATQPLAAIPCAEGANTFQWNGAINGGRVPDGEYALVFTLRTGNGMESMAHYAQMEVVSAATQGETPEPEETITFTDATEIPKVEETQPVETATEIPTQAPETPSGPESNPPYSSLADGGFWSMTPGELDDAVIWDIMTQPITVYKDVDQKDHVYLMENPDGTGAQVAQIHGQSQGLHVIGEVNANGYVLVEAFSSYDDVYTPTTETEKAHALEIKQGYIKASGLETIQVQQDYGLLIDKVSQRMYIFKDGKRITELLICTGLIADGKYHYETTPGEFITVSHSGGFFSNKYMYCDMAIRINGGILIHEVPYEPLGDGTKNYKPYEPLLGQKASHGCIRVQRQKNEDGFNQRWLWDNLVHGKPYKVLIWDDQNRYDTPEVWYPAGQ